MIKTGLFGGSFNPIHKGHIALASKLLRETGLDEVWFLVTPQNPWKQESDLLDDVKRLENTLQALSAAYPDRRFTLLVGGDNWERFDHWYEHDKILAQYEIAIYPRKGSKIDRQQLPANVRLVRTRLINISSTEIRQRVHDGLPIDDMVPKAIIPLVEKWY